MSYQMKRTVVSMLSGIALLVAYCVYVFNPERLGVAAAEGLKYWAKTMLIFIAIGIVVTIIIQIVFHILLSISIAVKKKMADENCEDKEIEKSIKTEIVEDEMDKLIELKSSRVGFMLSGVGLLAGLIVTALGKDPVYLLNIVFFSFSLGSLFEGFTQLYYYKKGV